MIGSHASISPSILEGIKYVHSIGGNAIQIFAGSNQSSLISTKQVVNTETAEEIKNYIQLNNLYLAIHAIYLLNFCSYPANSGRIKYAQDNLIYDINLAQKIGAFTVVLHIGYQKELSTEVAYNNMADNVIYILKKTLITAPDVSLSLETPAGQGSQIASTLPELSRLINLIITKLKTELEDNKIKKAEYNLLNRRLSVCIDTAHIFSSGTDIREAETFKDYFKNIDKEFGKRVKLIHLNDSKKPLNSRRDQHEGIGDGTIFNTEESKLSLIYLVKWAKKHKVPIILETHKAGSPVNPDADLYAQEIALLKNISKNISQNTASFNLKTLSKGKLTEEIKTWKLIHSTPLSKVNKTKKRKSSLKHEKINAELNGGILKRLLILRDYYLGLKDRFRYRAYSNAFLVLKNYPEEIKSGFQVSHLQGIGKQITEKIDQYLKNGEMNFFKLHPELLTTVVDATASKSKLKKTQKQSLNILGFGEKRIDELEKTGLKTIKQIRKAVSKGDLELTKGETLGLTYYEDLQKPLDRKTANELFKYISSKIEKAGILKRYKAEIEIAGSFQRGKEESKDLDLLLFTSKYKLPVSNIPEKFVDDIINCFAPDELKVYQKGHSKLLSIIIFRGIARHVDFRLLPTESEVAGRLYFTSGRDFNVMIRSYAAKKGYLLNEYGLYKRKNKVKGSAPIKLKSEEELFALIGLPFIPLYKRSVVGI